MKKIIGVSLLMAALGLSVPALAQTRVEKAGQGVKKGAKKVGNKTAELATKGKGRVTDKVSDTYVGPSGETIYVDNGSKYYWVDKKGKRHFVPFEALKPKESKR